MTPTTLFINSYSALYLMNHSLERINKNGYSPDLRPVTPETTFMLWFPNIPDNFQVSNRNKN